MRITQGIFLLLARLLRFARASSWHRRNGHPTFPTLPTSPEVTSTSECAHYLESILPQQAKQSSLARALPDGFRFALDIRGADGGQWSFRCGGAEILRVERGIRPIPDVIYRLATGTFRSLIGGRLSAQTAFLNGKIEIEGDMEKALLLAMFIEQFLAESFSPTSTMAYA